MSEEQRDIFETEDFINLVQATARDYGLEKWQKESQDATAIGTKYKQDDWYSQVQRIVGSTGRVLLVTDYSAQL